MQLREVKRIKITFRNGAEKTIKGVFYPERRMIYELDDDGDTIAVYNFDDVFKLDFYQNGRMSIKLVG